MPPFSCFRPRAFPPLLFRIRRGIMEKMAEPGRNHMPGRKGAGESHALFRQIRHEGGVP